MDFINEIKIKECDWHEFTKCISLDRTELFIQIEISIVLFDLDNEKTTFEDIIRKVKKYHEELTTREEIEDVIIQRERLSTIEPVFFQEYLQNLGIELTDYKRQAEYGAVYYCENFINCFYDNMEKNGLSRKC